MRGAGEVNSEPMTQKNKMPFYVIVLILALLLSAGLGLLGKSMRSRESLERDIASLELSSKVVLKKSERVLSVSSMAQVLNNGLSELPQRFSFKQLSFLPGTTDMTSAGDQELADLVSTLKKFPTTSVTIEAFIEETNDQDENLLLSENRAMLVREELIGRGIEPSRVEALGKGAQKSGPQVYLVLRMIK